MKSRDTLIDACYQARENPDFRPQDGTTRCNQASHFIASQMGYSQLQGRLANDIYDFCSASDQWSEVPIEKCQFLANQGSLVLAVDKGTPHGHVVVICPGVEKTSGRWGKVPSCVNLGKDVFIGRGINWAFSELPRFWVWRESL